MILDYFKRSAESAYVYLERYVNDGSPSGHSERSTSAHTAPKSDVPYLDLLEVILPSEIQFEEIGENTFFTFPEQTIIIHPDMLEEEIIRRNICGILRRIRAYPTATGRTVKVAGRDIFIKLTYNKLLGRMERQIARKNILAGLEVSSEIVEMLNNANAPLKSSVMKEKFGRVASLPLDQSFYEWGYVFREFRPYPYIPETEFLIPGFSLFSIDIHAPNDVPLLIQLFRKQRKELITFLLEDLIFPIYDTYFAVLTRCGIGLEAHAQNMLITIDKSYHIRRVVIRDLESAYRDLPLRKFLGVQANIDPACYKCINTGEYNYEIMHSFMFDFKLGEYLITPILECIEKYYKISIADIMDKIKKHNQAYIQLLPKNYFPSCWYNYSNDIFEPGQLRPYIKHENPKYR